MAGISVHCTDPSLYGEVDYSNTTLSAEPFLRRYGLKEQVVYPQRIAPQDWKVHRLRLQAPLPLAPLQSSLDGDPPPDRGQTLEWPHSG